MNSLLGGPDMGKKQLVLIIISSIVMLAFPQMQFAEEQKKSSGQLTTKAPSAILIEKSTGEILFEHDAHERLAPASMTKMMTLLLVMEAIEKEELSLEEKVHVSENASSMGGSQIFLEPGEEMSVQDLLKGVAIASGNDASVALAERIAGTEEAFVQLMNEKVKELKLKNTQFQNASGLPAKGQYSTAYDMAIIAKELLRHPITDYTSIYEDYLRKGQKNEFWLVNTNKLIRTYPGVDGLKTGFTNEAKYCLTATANRDNMRLITVVMGVETVKERNKAVTELFDYGFNQFETEELFKQGEAVKQLSLLKAENEKTPIVTTDAAKIIFAKGKKPDNLKTEINLERQLNLPLKKGETVGSLVIKQGQEVLSETDLIVDEEVKSASMFTFIKRSLQYLAKNKSIYQIKDN